jgi:cell division transport system ATP-binding protein
MLKLSKFLKTLLTTRRVEIGECIVISFDNVSKQYKNTSSPALDSINLDIEQGDFVFLVGASGSGKSSLLRLLLKEETATTGVVTVDGINVAKLRNRKVPAYRRTMGIVFQDFRLLPGKTVFENVAFGMEVIGKPKSEIARKVPALLELVGLEEKSHRLPSELSGGEQQRVAMARAFVNQPKLLLADEPTGNLDPATSVGIMKLLDRINRIGTTVIMATHDVAIVDQMRKRIVQMEDGRIVRDQERGMYGQTGQ